MKTLTLLIICILFGTYVMAQNKCKDAVHPTENRKSILNCCIKEVKPGNIVVYKLSGTLYEIEAVAINYKGEYFDLNNNTEIFNIVYEDNYPGILYDGHDYAYYNDLYKKANGQMTIGIALTAIGGGMVVGSFAVMVNNAVDYDSGEGIGGTGIGLLLLGATGIGVGIPVMISGATKKKRYQVPMNEIKRQANLSFRTTNHGVGLVMKF
jgi:hypothetical protein